MIRKFVDDSAYVPIAKKSKRIVRKVIVDTAGASGFDCKVTRGEYILKRFKRFERVARKKGCSELRRQVSEHKTLDRAIEAQEVQQTLARLAEKKRTMEEKRRKRQEKLERQAEELAKHTKRLEKRAEELRTLVADDGRA